MRKHQIKGESQLKKLSELIDFISAKFGKRDCDISIMNERIEKLEEIVDRQEKYSRHN